jgi:hypothetical protein
MLFIPNALLILARGQYLKEKEFNPDRPRDAEWGERYFHLHDPDGHELSFAQPVAQDC